MTISLVQSKNNGGAGLSSYTLTLDQVPIQGNMLLFFVMTDNPRVHTSPGGVWVKVTDVEATGGPTATVWKKFAEASESQNLIHAFTGGTDLGVMAAVELSGDDLEIEAFDEATDIDLGTSATYPPLTPAGAARMYGWAACSSGITTPTINQDYWNLQQAITADIRAVLNEYILAASATKNPTISFGTGTPRVALIHLAVREAVAVTGSSVITRRPMKIWSRPF